MLKPTWDGKDVPLLEKFPDLKFFLRRVFDPIADVVGDFQRRFVFVMIFLERLECDGTVPFLSAHRQKVFRRIGHQRDIFEKKYVSVAPKCSLVRERRQFLLKLLPKISQARLPHDRLRRSVPVLLELWTL